jgi:hypothetical protein
MEPAQLEIAIGGYTGDSYHIKWEEGKLAYTSMGYGYSGESPQWIQPSAEQWEKFQKALGRLNVWAWEANYPNSGGRDGTHWSVDIEWNGKSLHSSGDNHYPESESPEPGQSFRQFLQAVQALIGGLEFE